MYDNIMRGKDNIIPKLGQNSITKFVYDNVYHVRPPRRSVNWSTMQERVGVCTLCEPNSKLKIIWQDNLTPSRGGKGLKTSNKRCHNKPIHPLNPEEQDEVNISCVCVHGYKLH